MNNNIRSCCLKTLLMGMVLAAYTLLSLARDSGEATVSAKKIPPIYIAAKQGNLAAVRSLIAQGEDVNAVNAAGHSTLMSAVFFSNRGIQGTDYRRCECERYRLIRTYDPDDRSH
jgi:ankyrin repeat protein